MVFSSFVQCSWPSPSRSLRFINSHKIERHNSSALRLNSVPVAVIEGFIMLAVVYILSLYMGFRPHGWPPYPCLCSVLFFPELLNFFFSFGLRHIDIVAQGVGALYVYMRRRSQVCGYCVILLLWWLCDVVHHIYVACAGIIWGWLATGTFLQSTNMFPDFVLSR